MAEAFDSQIVKIGRYELVSRLAIGGMAELFLARERGLAGLERLVVIKRILPHLAHEPSFVDMFLREARIAARLAHPNVVQIFELNESAGSYYIAMEYIHGSTVRELQVLSGTAHTRFPLEVTVGVLEQAARGLHAAHELTDLDGKALGLVHRDISPHNLMVTVDGNVKLLDFGVAKATEGVESTYSGNLKGKFAYMSPEQCMRSKLDRRSDVFGLGVVAWELCTGHRLFKRDTELAMMQAITSGDVRPPSSVGIDVPMALEDAIMKALAVDRDRRWESVEAFRQALLELSRAEGYQTGGDRIAAFVRDVAGDRLTERSNTLQAALERALTSKESAGLLHKTGSRTTDDADTHIESSRGSNSIDKLPLPTRDSASGSVPSDSRSLLPEASTSQGGDPGASLETRVSRLGRDDGVDEAAQTTEMSAAHSARIQAAARQPAPKPDPEPAPKKKRTLLLTFVALGVVIAAGIAAFVFGNSGDQTTSSDETVLLGEPLRLGWAPTISVDVLIEEVEPLHRYLEKSIQRPVPLVMAESYDDLAQKLVDGEIEFAVLPPLLFVRTKSLNPNIDPLVIKTFQGATKSDALLIVPMNSPVEELKDLEGKRFCFTNPSSTSGYFLPRSYFRRRGFDPETFIGAQHMSGEHIQVMKDLLDGKCDAAATYSGALIAGDELGIKTGRIRTLAITGHIPQDVIAAGPNVSDSAKDKMRSALLEFDPMKVVGERSLGKTQRIESFVRAENSDYDSLRSAMETEAETLEAQK